MMAPWERGVTQMGLRLQCARQLCTVVSDSDIQSFRLHHLFLVRLTYKNRLWLTEAAIGDNLSMLA